MIKLGSIARYKWLIAILAIGLAIRIYLAPYSTGSDIPQFAGFADTFLMHGLCFYKYSDGSKWFSEGWVYPWPYVYGPMLAILLAPIRFFIRSPMEAGWRGSTYYVYASLDWVVGVKALFILFDTLSAIILYILARRLGGGRWGILCLLLYYLNPMTIYISAIYGMFDQVALFFYLLTITFILRERLFASGLLAALTLLTKHTFLYPVTALFLYIIVRGRWRTLVFLAGAIVASAILLLPFIAGCPGSLGVLIKAVTSTSKPGYTEPIVYSFNGFSSLATLYHKEYGIDTLWAIEYWYIPSIALLLLVYAKLLRNPRCFLIPASLSYIVYTATYWRVNHQYLVPSIALLLLLAILEENKLARTTAILLTIWIGLWPVMFPTSWWFHAHIKEPNQQLINTIDKLTLMIFNEKAYVAYSLTLTILHYITIVLATIKREWTGRDLNPGPLGCKPSALPG